MQCGLPLQHRRVSAWNRYHSGARPLLPSAAHRPPLWQVWWGLWALLFPAPFLTSGQHCMCYLLWVTLTPGFYLLPVALGQAGDRTFHMVTQTEGAPPIPPPPTHTHTASAQPQFPALSACGLCCGLSLLKREVLSTACPWPTGPCNHGPCSLLPFREEPEASVFTAVARSCCFFTRINVALWLSSPTSYELRCVPQEDVWSSDPSPSGRGPDLEIRPLWSNPVKNELIILGPHPIGHMQRGDMAMETDL